MTGYQGQQNCSPHAREEAKSQERTNARWNQYAKSNEVKPASLGMALGKSRDGKMGSMLVFTRGLGQEGKLLLSE